MMRIKAQDRKAKCGELPDRKRFPSCMNLRNLVANFQIIHLVPKSVTTERHIAPIGYREVQDQPHAPQTAPSALELQTVTRDVPRV